MYIAETNSTSTLLHRLLSGEESREIARYAACLREPIPMIYTDFQTAGRGQSGNSWESERGKNLLFSFALLAPRVAIVEQFLLSMAVAVAMWETLSSFLPCTVSKEVYIKWPNDIYYRDKKLAGILVENTLQGSKIAYSIIGIGLNINQLEWMSKAPNPISLQMITGVAYSVEGVLQAYMERIGSVMERRMEEVRAAYMEHLYRREGFFPYVEREVSLVPTAIMRSEERSEGIFRARIEDITSMGELVLRTEDGERRVYHFKQIRFVL